jgi:thiol-disulfide isomerase/thioredoxin
MHSSTVRVTLASVVAIVVAAVGVGGCTSTSPTNGNPSRVVTRTDEPLPVLEGRTLDGKEISTRDFAGRVLVLNVWASWCGPCTAEQPALARLANRYEDDGVSFLGINHANEKREAIAWAENYDVPYPSLHDPNGAFADDLGYPYLPDTFVVDASGTLRVKIFGETNEQELGQLIDEVLADQATSASTATAPNSAAR